MEDKARVVFDSIVRMHRDDYNLQNLASLSLIILYSVVSTTTNKEFQLMIEPWQYFSNEVSSYDMM